MIRLLRTFRASRFKPVIVGQKEFYSREWSRVEIAGWQLERFNEQWQSIRCNVPYFASLSRERFLPERFKSWSEFSALMPVMERGLIQSRRDDLCDPTRSPDFSRTTGGSTSEPVQLPAWNSELAFSTGDLWLARSGFGVSPADKLFLIWGHSHLLGRGLRGRLNRLKRRAKDKLLGYRRHSAYDLSEAALRRAGGKLLKFKPAYVLGYSVALDRFARVNADRQNDFHKLGLKVAIATAESFPRPDSAGMVADVLGCPVAMEYGAVETGIIAHQSPGGDFNVFWRHHFVEGVESREVPGSREILVTTLYPRCFPLVRYRLGDLIVPAGDVADLARRFASVTGRCNDSIVLKDGVVIHSEAFAHAIKECPGVLSYQVLQRANGEVRFSYLSAPGGIVDEREIRRRLSLIHPALGGVVLQSVAAMRQTVAGKTCRIVREKNHGG